MKISTWSICPVCLKDVTAEIVKSNNKIYLLKLCKKHGKFKALLCGYASYYERLIPFLLTYKRQKTYNLVITSRCNLNCPICFVGRRKNYHEPSLSWIRNVLISFKNTKINLFGGEPTIRSDLPEIIKLIKSMKNFVSMYTNGIKIANLEYLKKLKKAGLDEVHLQFDGFSDRIYKKLRGAKLLKVKMLALKNLEMLDIPTVLEVTIAKGLNEGEMKKILEFSIRKKFIKTIIFRSYGFLGSAKLNARRKITVDEMINVLEIETNGKISKEKVLEFQMLLMHFYKELGFVPCLNNAFLLLLRNENNYEVINDVLNLKNKKSFSLKFYIILNLLKRMDIFFPLLFSFLLGKFRGMNSFNLHRKLLVIDFEFPCDIYTFNKLVIRNCMGGEIRTDCGILRSKCLANILQEKLRVNK